MTEPGADDQGGRLPLGVAHGARGGIVRDPFGHRWFLQTAIEV